MICIPWLLVFLVFALLRGRHLFGWHLSPVSPGSDELAFGMGRRSKWFRHIGIVQQGGVPFVIRRECWYHRFLKRLGVASEISVGDGAFDRDYFITTDFPGQLEQLLASEGLRQAVQDLFKLQVRSLHATSRRMWCVIDPRAPGRVAADFAPHMRLLREISAASRSLKLRQSVPAMARWRGVLALLFIALQAGLLSIGFLWASLVYLDTVSLTDPVALIAKGAALGLLFALIWNFVILAVFSGSSWASWVMADFGLFGLLGFVLTGIVFVHDTNLRADPTAIAIHAQPVVEKTCELKCRTLRSGRRVTSYPFSTAEACSPQSRDRFLNSMQLEDSKCASSAWFEYSLGVAHWRGGALYRFPANKEFFDAVGMGETVKVPVHPGALGLEWVNWTEIRKN